MMNCRVPHYHSAVKSRGQTWLLCLRLGYFNANVYEKLMVTHLVMKLPTSYGTRKFITVFTRSAIGSCPEPGE